MKAKLMLFIAALFLGSMTCMAQEPKLDDVLSAYVKGVGIEKMKDWKTVRYTGKSQVQGVEYPFIMIQKRPEKIRIDVEIQGSKMIQAFDGTSGWTITPWSGSSDPQDMTPDDMKTMKSQADMEGALFNWKEKGHKAELIDKEDLDGTPVFKIKLTKADGDVENWFIDAENYVPLKIVSIIKIQGNDSESETDFSNYTQINGVLMAKTMATKFKGIMVSQIETTKVEINLPVSDSLFVKPVKK